MGTGTNTIPVFKVLNDSLAYLVMINFSDFLIFIKSEKLLLYHVMVLGEGKFNIGVTFFVFKFNSSTMYLKIAKFV